MQSVTSIEDNFTVGLQDMYSYSPLALIIMGIILLVPIIFLLVRYIIRSRKKAETADISPVITKDINKLKDRYNAMILELIDSYKNGKTDDKHAYQKLSRIIRHFVYDATGIRVQNYTLTEIAALNMPGLYYLIDECYEPEFSTDINKDILGTCEKARKVITEWN